MSVSLRLILVCYLSLTFTSESVSAGLKLEAEDATLTGVNVSSARIGFSGTGYVTGFNDNTDKITFTFEIKQGIYSVFIGYSLPNGEKGFDLVVNGITSSGMLIEGSSTYLEASAGKYQFNEGNNTIIIKNGWGWYDVDYILITPSVNIKIVRPTSGLVDSEATQPTLDLYDFLLSQYGHHVISGQQDLIEIEYVKSTTGLSPAVGGFDLIDYSPTRQANGASPQGYTESWINWRNTGGGILAGMWHWNAPTDLIDEPGKEWWRGFYTNATTFDLEAALADNEGENYQLLINDIDVIAVELKKIQDAGFPVLWRPLHEASGGWFWWGAKGPEAFIELWQILFDRLKNHHEIHNLIWVYTADEDNPEWYPGDEYVDIIGLDIYTHPSDNMSGKWDNILTQFNGNKLITLSETGTIPIPANINLYDTWWSWFSIWTGEFIRDINKNQLTIIYQDEDIITLDELPDWDNYVTPEPQPEITGLEDYFNNNTIIYPNPVKDHLNIDLNLDGVTKLEVKVIDIVGQIVLKQSLSDFISNLVSIDVRKIKSGTYFLHLKCENFEINYRFIKTAF